MRSLGGRRHCLRPPSNAFAHPAMPSPTRQCLRLPGNAFAHPAMPLPTRQCLCPPGNAFAHPAMPSPTRQCLRPPSNAFAHPAMPSPTRQCLRPPGNAFAHPALPSPTPLSVVLPFSLAVTLPSPTRAPAEPGPRWSGWLLALLAKAPGKAGSAPIAGRRHSRPLPRR